MSYLSRALEELLQRQKLKPADIAKSTKIEPAKISRWRSGEQTHISPDDLAKIAVALKAPEAHGMLLRAHLLDECGGHTSLVNIELRDSKAVSEEPRPDKSFEALPPKLEHAFKILSERVVSDRDLQKMVLSLANLYEKGSLK